MYDRLSTQRMARAVLLSALLKRKWARGHGAMKAKNSGNRGPFRCHMSARFNPLRIPRRAKQVAEKNRKSPEAGGAANRLASPVPTAMQQYEISANTASEFKVQKNGNPVSPAAKRCNTYHPARK